MKYFIQLAALLLLWGCSTLEDEISTPGGAESALYDSLYFSAVTHEEHTDRYLYALARVAPLTLVTAQTKDEARESIDSVVTALKALSAFSQTLEKCNFTEAELSGTINDCTVDASSFAQSDLAFEINSFEMQRYMRRVSSDLSINLGFSTVTEARSAGDVVSALVDVLKGSKDILGSLREAAAMYRDSTQIVARSVARQCHGDDRNCSALRASLKSLYITGDRQKLASLRENDLKRLEEIQSYVDAIVNQRSLADGKTSFFDDAGREALRHQIRFACLRAVANAQGNAGDGETASYGLVENTDDLTGADCSPDQIIIEEAAEPIETIAAGNDAQDKTEDEETAVN